MQVNHRSDSGLPLPLLDLDECRSQLANASIPFAAIKDALNDFKLRCNERFTIDLDADPLVYHRAKEIDRLLQLLWQFQGPSQEANIALIAVGGYGRGELHPYSDIDLLLLADNEESITSHASTLQSFITLLWDLKLDIGHSVRTLNECVTEAGNDLTIITNLLESRCLAGAEALLPQLNNLVTPEKIWPAKDFFKAKFNEVSQRHDKHNDPEYNLEPNVKNSPGALRDIQTVVWVTRRYFNDGSLSYLNKHGFLTDYEVGRLDAARRFFWSVRYALHMVSDREEDRLLFNLQPEVADILGFEQEGRRQAVEVFMATFYRHQLTITEMCDLLLLHFDADYIDANSNDTIEPVNEHFCLRNGYLSLQNDDLFSEQPSWLLRVFLLMAQLPAAKGMDAATIRAIIDNRHRIDDDFRRHPEHNALFMQLLRNRSCVVRELTRMMRYSILGRYLPEFGNMIGWMEYDLFHKYTVDEHSLRMIRLLRHFRYGEIRERFPLSSKIINRVEKKEILYLVALLHDTGKFDTGDHTHNGELIAQRVCEQHKLSKSDTQLVRWLVSNHLIMSQASQRLDLNDPDDIHQFAIEVGDINRLNYLFLISVTDIFSTNPDLWTPWRAEQMRDLYRNTQQALRRGLDNPMNRQQLVEDIQQEAMDMLFKSGMQKHQVLDIWGEPGDEYFLREGVDNIVWHTLEISRHSDSTNPLIAIRQTSSVEFEQATQIFIFMQDQPDLFAVTTATLDLLDLNIQDARIMVSEKDKNAVDTYIVLDNQNKPIINRQELKRIKDTLSQALANPDDYSTVINRRTPRLLKQFQVETQVTLSNDPLLQRTVIEVIAADRPGLLARVGQTLARFNAQIVGAKILTEGERVADIFYVVDEDGKPFSDVAECRAIQHTLIRDLDEQIEAQTLV